MWFHENAKIIDYIKYFTKRKGIRVGLCPTTITDYSFIKPYHTFYYKNQASTRLRVNDFIYYSLCSNKINSRFYYPYGKFDILIFQKNFSKDAYLLASKYKLRGTKIILDINVNFFDLKSKRILETQYQDIMNFLNVTDLIITTTNYLKNYILENNIFTNVVVIHEILSEDLFKISKIHKNKKTHINFLYFGYAVKASELENIKYALEQ